MFGLGLCVACRDPGDCLSPVCCCRDPDDCLSPMLVWALQLLLSKDFWSGKESDVFFNAEKGIVDPGKERAERVLASAISIIGRKEWTCKFCSGSDVLTRWRCRHAVAAKNGDWPTGSSTASGEEDRRAKSLEAK